MTNPNQQPVGGTPEKPAQGTQWDNADLKEQIKRWIGTAKTIEELRKLEQDEYPIYPYPWPWDPIICRTTAGDFWTIL